MAGSVLVVDDSALARAYLVDILHKIGAFSIAEAENGAVAVEMFKASPADLVLLDVEMPVMDGVAAARILGPIKGEARIVMMTAIGFDGVIDDCLKAGADDYIRKDSTDEAIMRRLRDILI